MTIQEIAQREGISERQAQRYVREGFQGHILKATKVGKAYHVDEGDYAAWRIACGFEQPRSEESSEPPASPSRDAHPAAGSSADPVPPYPPYPMPADPHGVITNCPHPHSCNFPHPLACEAYMKQEAQKLVEKYQGAPDAEN